LGVFETSSNLFAVISILGNNCSFRSGKYRTYVIESPLTKPLLIKGLAIGGDSDVLKNRIDVSVILTVSDR
jgi:hypothetical protein